MITADKWVRFQYYKRINEEKVQPALWSIGEKDQAIRVDRCGEFVKVAKCNGCGTKHFKGHTSCQVRWCMNCMHKKLLCWVKRLVPIFEAWYAEGNFVSMLNFTVRDAMPLTEPLEMLETSYRALYNSNSRKRRDFWQDRFPGGVRSLEVKIGSKSGQWHPHYHCLVMQRSGEFIKDYDWLSRDWHNIVGHNGREVVNSKGQPDMDWNGNVYIRKVSERRKNGILQAVCESLKYIMKVDGKIFGRDDGSAVNMTLFEEAYFTLKNKRQTSTWGLLYNISDEVENDFEEEETYSLVNFICQRCGCTEGELLDMVYGYMNKDRVLFDISNDDKKISAPGTKRSVQTDN